MLAVTKANTPTRLRIEHLEDACGIDEKQPRLSWWLPEGAQRQVAYRLRTKDWSSGRIESDNHLLVAFPGPPMQSRQRVECAVKVWTDQGESEWSDTVRWEMGLLDPSDWKAKWIEPPEGADIPPSGKRPGWHLRHEFSAVDPPVTARLYATHWEFTKFT
jgi:alpha-L-rhamnosidase